VRRIAVALAGALVLGIGLSMPWNTQAEVQPLSQSPISTTTLGIEHHVGL
jgi:hypothetical protein